MDEREVFALERIAAALEGVCQQLGTMAAGNAKIVTENFAMRLLREREARAVTEEMRRERPVDQS